MATGVAVSTERVKVAELKKCKVVMLIDLHQLISFNQKTLS